MIKFYSEKTGKYYNTLEEANKAEFEAKEAENRQKILAERKAAEEKERKEKEAEERKTMAADIEEKRKAMVAAQKAYSNAIDQFTKRWGSYHYSSNSADDIPMLFKIFNPFFFD